MDSAHDCSDGGIAVALVESGLAKGIGMNVDLTSLRTAAGVCSVRRGRQPGGHLVRPREGLGRIQQVAVKYGITAEIDGETAPKRVEIKLDGRVVVSAAVSEFREVYEGALKKLRTEVETMAAD